MPLTVRDFLEAGRTPLGVECISGEGHLDRVIPEPALNRPGLALAGFLQYVANKRVQVMGLAELTYLKSLASAERRERLSHFFEKHIPAIVVTRNRLVPKDLLRVSEKYHVPVIRTPLITMDFLNRGTLLLDELTSPRLRAQGTTVDVMGIGVMLEGEPGIGKSETAMALVRRGHSLVADDTTVLQRDSTGAIIASAVDVTRFHMEIRGLGIIHVPALFGVASMRLRMKLDLVVRLHHQRAMDDVDRTGLTPQTRDILGVAVPVLNLPVGPGRDISLIVEVAAMNQKLKLLGHDAAKELDERLIKTLLEKASR